VGQVKVCAVPDTAPAALDLESSIHAFGLRLAELSRPAANGPAKRAERWLTGRLAANAELRAALFRFVDVRPACTSDADVGRHLGELLAQAPQQLALTGAGRLARSRLTRRPVGRIASWGVRRMATSFIVGEDPLDAAPVINDLWRRGVGTSVDLLGEATITEHEADRYAARCKEALHTLDRAARGWGDQPLLERDSSGPLPRVNLSVKVSALTPCVRALAPSRGIRGADARLRDLLRTARDLGAHLHVDMESVHSRETVLGLTLGMLEEAEFADGPSVGIVVQAYLRDSGGHVAQILDWTAGHARSTPLTIRLVKGAYWDHEVVEAAQNLWQPPVIEGRAACDRNFEVLTRELVRAFPRVRLAIASHNLRSIAHAACYAEAAGLPPQDIEFQVLRGLGDATQAALAAIGRRVRCYCPVGDLVAGMSYLVRRLLENTSNDSFLRAHAAGRDIDLLLAAP
jgi:RHH-type proline utilization regulon transcriptional repressor/proline dehydrogenase/delta 1-pyrroline-5-carboxylate dehydrogenase